MMNIIVNYMKFCHGEKYSTPPRAYFDSKFHVSAEQMEKNENNVYDVIIRSTIEGLKTIDVSCTKETEYRINRIFDDLRNRIILGIFTDLEKDFDDTHIDNYTQMNKNQGIKIYY